MLHWQVSNMLAAPCRDLRDDRPSAGGSRRKRRHRSVLDPRNLLVIFVLATCFASMLWVYSRFTKLP